jgi:putative hydrolase of the HAD superfamily
MTHWPLFEGAAGALGRLRRNSLGEHHYHLGIITNGAADDALDSQYTKARRTGLLDRVDSFLASDTAGYRKPDPRIFALALERAGVAPHEALYVGDSIGNDVVGANRAGMVSVLLWHGDEPVPELVGDERPAHAIASLAELEGILAG